MPPLQTPDEYSLETICYDGVVIRSHFEADNEGLGPAVYHEFIICGNCFERYTRSYQDVEEDANDSFVAHTMEGHELLVDTDEFVAAAHQTEVRGYLQSMRTYFPHRYPTLKDIR